MGDSHGLIVGEIDPEPVRDLLGAPRCRPPSILSGPMTATDPAHLGAWHQLTIGAGDNATETILDVPAKLVVPRRASPPSDGRRADPNATARSWPDTPGLRYGLRRCAPTHVRSSTVTDPTGGRSPPPHSRGRGEPRSLLAQQKTNSAPKQGQKKMGPSRHSRGTNANQPDPMLTPPDRRTTRRPHRRPQRTISPTNLPCFHCNSSLSRRCDDRLNPPSIYYGPPVTTVIGPGIIRGAALGREDTGLGWAIELAIPYGFTNDELESLL